MPGLRHLGSVTAGVLALILTLVTGGLTLRLHEPILTAIEEAGGAGDAALFDAGVLQEGWYSNRLAGFAIRVPQDWSHDSLNTIYRRTAARMPAANVAEAVQKVPSAYPLFHFEDRRDPVRMIRPSFALIGYDKKAYANFGILTLEQYAASVAAGPDPSQPLNPPIRERLGSIDGYRIQRDLSGNGVTIRNRLYVFENERFFLTLMASGADSDRLEFLPQAIASLRKVE